MKNNKNINLYLFDYLVEYSDYISTIEDENILNKLKKIYFETLDNKRQSQIELVMIYEGSPNQTNWNNLKKCNLYIIELKTKLKLINNQLDNISKKIDNISKKNEILNNAKIDISKYIKQ